ncbi:MAG: hypothetical protein LUP99_04750 [Methanomicrobiales archaeon]|nr:hypothetical protein [Methanomicrobiales archaeon]
MDKINTDTAWIREMYCRNGLTAGIITYFRNIICTHYRIYGRTFPWRETDDPYRILVSEFMLQQTQVKRVQERYIPFLEQFPDFFHLSSTTIPEVLRAWKGLGYNRRALALRQTAQIVVRDYRGMLPVEEHEIQALPGIGKATTAALMVFTSRQPSLLLETNIRTVYIHFFFPDRERVKDTELHPLIEKTQSWRHPREWYYGLIDCVADMV